MASELQLRCTSLPNYDSRLAFTNCAYLNSNDYSTLFGNQASPNYLQIKDYVFTVSLHDAAQKGVVMISQVQRRLLFLAIGDNVDVIQYIPQINETMQMMKIDVSLWKKSNVTEEFVVAKIKEIITKTFLSHYFAAGQIFVIDYYGIVLECKVLSLSNKTQNANDNQTTHGFRGRLSFDTNIHITSTSIKLADNPPLDPNHIKGLLLAGPSWGQSLLARNIAKSVSTREPMLVSATSMINRFVGQSSAKEKTLLGEAEEDYLQHGQHSPLHAIIIDDFDAVSPSRNGSHWNSTQEFISNLANGFEKLNNIFVIGLMNDWRET